jgi:hypothetical protein
VGSCSSPAITICEIDPIGKVQTAELSGTTEVMRTKLVEQEGGTTYRRSILITSNDVIVGDIMDRVEQQVVQERKTFISFHPRLPSSESTCSTIEIPGNMEVVRMARLRDQHAIVLCRAFLADSQDAPMVEPVGGHWLRGAHPLSHRTDVHAFVFHVPTRCQVGRFCLLEDVSNHLFCVPHISADSGDTIGVALSWKGLVMTGNDIRCVGGNTTVPNDSSPPRSGKKKKKKGSRVKREGKKDEFARGMRQSF